MQARDALDHNPVAPRTLNLRAHRDQAISQINHLRFACRILDHGFAVSEHCRHHQVFCPGDGHQVGHDAGALEFFCLGDNIAVFNAHGRTKNFEALDVLIHRACTNRTTAGQRDPRRAKPRHQRTQHEDRRAHGLDHLVRCNRVDRFFRAQGYTRAVTLDRHTHLCQQFDRGADIFQRRHIVEHQRFGRQQTGAENRQRSVFRA